MYPILYEKNDILISTHGVMMFVAYLAGLIFAVVQWKKIYGNLDDVLPFFEICFIASLIGARAMTAIENYTFYLDHPSEFFKIWKGGYGFWGGLLVALIAGSWHLKRHAFNIFKITDELAIPAALLGLGIGRLGCLAAGCEFGRVSTLPWTIRYTDPRSAVHPLFLGVPVHPLSLYISLDALVLFLISLWLQKHKRYDGEITFVILALFSISRFLVEFLRSEYNRPPSFGGLDSPQLVSILIFVGSVVGLYTLHRWQHTFTKQNMR